MELPADALFHLAAERLKGLRNALVLWLGACIPLFLLGLLQLSIHWGPILQSHSTFFVAWFALPTVAVFAVILLSINVRRSGNRGKFPGFVAAAGIGSAILLLFAQVLMLTVFGGAIANERIAAIGSALGLVSMPVVGASFHLMIARLMRRVPRVGLGTMHLLTSVLILAWGTTWTLAFTTDYFRTGLHVPLILLLPFASAVLSLGSVGAAVYRVRRVLQQRLRFDATQGWPTEPA